MIRYSNITMLGALVWSAINGFAPSYITEIWLWGTCVLFILERERA